MLCHVRLAVFLVIVLVGSMLPLLAAAPTPEETSRFTEAQTAAYKHGPDTALDLLTQFAQDYPTSTYAPEVAYLTGMCYLARKQYAEASPVLEHGINTYKSYNSRMKACILLFRASLQLQQPEKAAFAFEEVVKSYPAPPLVLEMLDAEYQFLREADPEKGLDPYTKFTKYADLPPAWGVRERLLWFKALSVTDEKLFIQEALAAAPRWTGNKSMPDLVTMLLVGQLLYEPMMRNGRATEARAFSDHLQDLIAAKGNPFKLAEMDTKAYFEKLAKFSPQDFATQGKPLIRTLKWATTVAEAGALQPFIAQYYTVALREACIEDAREMHAFIQKTLGDLGYTDLAAQDKQAFKAGYSLTTIAALCARAKVLIAREKEAEATRLVTELNEIAPEAPEVRQLVKIYEEFMAERKK